MLSQALNGIQQTDLSWLTPDRTKAHAEAIACTNDIAASDRRLKGVMDAFKQTGRDDGAAATQDLAIATTVLSGFDTDRTLSADQLEAIAAGRRARARIDGSDKRIAALEDAGRGFTMASPAPSYAALVDAARAITPFDRSRMGDSDLALFDQADMAADRLRESDSRLQELHSALSMARASSEMQIRERLIAAVAGLTDFDTSRSDPSFNKDAAEARALAHRFALDELLAEAKGFDANVASPDKVAKLAALRVALGSAVDDANPAQQEAIKVADRSSVMLTDSDRRLDALTAAAAAWDKDPSPSTAPQAMAALAPITDFDRDRFDQAHEQAFATLEAARQVVDLKEGRGTVTLAALKELPLFIFGSPGNEGAPYVAVVQDAFRADGFRLVASHETAALAIELNGTVLGSQRVEDEATARVEVDLNAVWVYDGTGFRQDERVARSGGLSEEVAIERSYDDAAKELYKSFVGGLSVSPHP